MKLSNMASFLTFAAVATAATVSYDTSYDNPDQSLDTVSCSNGQYGLITRYGWTTQGDVAGFPFIGGAQAVAGWNSPSCGTCWSLEWDGNLIYVLAIDHAAPGFNIGLEAMNALTNGQAEGLGRIRATTVQVNVTECGLEE